jgi:rod shape-determining protein MreD
MRRLTLLLIILAAVSLDCAVLTKLSIAGIRLSLSLCVLVCIAVVYGRLSGALAGLAIGVILDILFAPAFGFYSLDNMLTGYIADVIYAKGMRDEPLTIGLFAAGMYLVREAICALLSLMLGVKIGNFLFLLVRYQLPSAILTGIVCVPLFAAMNQMMTTGYMKRRKTGLD